MEPIHRIVTSYTGLLTQIYSMTALVLFGVTCYATISALNYIHHQLELCNEIPNHFLNLKHLQQLKNVYCLVCDSVNAISNCFGWNLLLSTLFLFTALINQTFEICLYYLSTKTFTLVGFTFEFSYLIQLSLICIPIHTVQSKVMYFLLLFDDDATFKKGLLYYLTGQNVVNSAHETQFAILY